VKEYSKKGLFTVIVALSKVFGPGIETHPVSVNKIINNFIRGKLLFVPGLGTTVANYCFINDIINGHLLAMQHGLGGEKYILGGYNLSYNSLFTEIKAISKSKAIVVHLPRYIITLLAIINWCKYIVTKKEPYVTLKGIRHIFMNKEFDNTKAMRQLHYQPTPFAEALTQTIQFLKSHQHA
jgi:nucleoside-diphosphate-sugar epimerase